MAVADEGRSNQGKRGIELRESSIKQKKILGWSLIALMSSPILYLGIGFVIPQTLNPPAFLFILVVSQITSWALFVFFRKVRTTKGGTAS